MRVLFFGPVASYMVAVGIFFLSVIIVSWVAITYPGWAQSSPVHSTGEFVGAGCPKRDLACVPTAPSDKVKISQRKDGALQVSIRIEFDRGQICQLDAAAILVAGVIKIQTEGIERDRPCELTLRRSLTILTLEDPGQRCREVYCGSRGTFDGTRFRQK